ncbi:predicted protein [Sclerotinia sclerotiorum 1980 UF-70]|uniref:Uncharacterized protein n=1 Tax=Sclerotinia sclerotiorum (strain ATCC 18683 / 1980 / Ss-1) TaxID=665079 RepID=A7F936_SCLS1|nr:predicted protein [Sclerotinia sclerotiorum 1980 UF-70]EDN99257.1 predicted protein [Sclerotinia sclerotiorum 1980 UF-70]
MAAKMEKSDETREMQSKNHRNVLFIPTAS